MEMLEFIQEVKKECHDHKNVADKSPTKPGALKSLGKWCTWWEKFDGYLSQTTGAAEISLNYIYQPHQQVTDEMHAADYVMNDDHYYVITVLEGAHYREDNKHMYEELQALTIDGPGWTFIKNFQRARNGRAAILALKAQSKGWSAIETRKQEAYAMLALACYAGPRCNWTFQEYVQHHQDVHQELEICNEAIPETKKVTDFLASITDPRLDNAKDLILGNAMYLTSFTEMQQYIVTLVSNKKTQSSRERQISEVDIRHGGQHKGGKKGGKGGRKGGGRKGGQDDGGELKIHSGTYSRKEWQQLGTEGQNKVRALRKKEQEQKDEQEKKQKVSFIETEEGGDAQGDEEPNSQFGQDAHKKGKRN